MTLISFRYICTVTNRRKFKRQVKRDNLQFYKMNRVRILMLHIRFRIFSKRQIICLLSALCQETERHLNSSIYFYINILSNTKLYRAIFRYIASWEPTLCPFTLSRRKFERFRTNISVSLWYFCFQNFAITMCTFVV